MTATRTASMLISLIAIVFILIKGQDLIVPLVLATMLWALVREIKQGLDKSRFMREKIPGWLKSLLISVALIGIVGLLFKILINSTKSVTKSYDLYKSNVEVITNQINALFDIDLASILGNQLAELNFATLFSSLLNELTSIFSSAFMILLYILFIFLEEANFSSKIKVIVKNESQYQKLVDVLESIEESVTKYLGLKIFVSLITGILSYFVLIFIGVDGPVFWAFLIFILNFIPTIGSLIATFFPAIFSVLQFAEFGPGLMVLGLVGAIQIIVGNFIEPKVMGNSLNISSLVAIFALMLWGSIWGVTGMLLSIPITVIMVIILSQFPQTRNLAIMLSKDGSIVKK